MLEGKGSQQENWEKEEKEEDEKKEEKKEGAPAGWSKTYPVVLWRRHSPVLGAPI